jgi:hypothetical protein
VEGPRSQFRRGDQHAKETPLRCGVPPTTFSGGDGAALSPANSHARPPIAATVVIGMDNRPSYHDATMGSDATRTKDAAGTDECACVHSTQGDEAA